VEGTLNRNDVALELFEYEDEESYEPSPFDLLRSEALITDVLRPLKSGKEASVYLCRGAPGAPVPLVAVKDYHARERRNFKNDRMYKEGRVINKRRIRVAMEKKTRFGRQVEDGMWISREWEVLEQLYRADCAVPQPLSLAGRAIAMAFVGDESNAAPQLRHVTPSWEEAREWYEMLLDNVELFLANNLVHGDLSPYNVLVWEGDVTIIDLPQAVDARTNPNARDLLHRDVGNISAFFDQFGVRADPDAVAERLWRRFILGEL
jgi:RIO kinase 1